MAFVRSRISNELKQAFSQYCLKENITESKVLIRCIKDLLPDDILSSIETHKELKTNQVKIQLSDKMIEKLDKKYTSEGYDTRTEWVTSCVLAALNRSAVLTDDEQKTLRESNRQLAAVGRNLNQISKAINTDSENIHSISDDLLDEILTEITSIKKSISALIRKNRSRWS